MKRKSGFDEVMIVNPSELGPDKPRRVTLMRFHNVFPSEMSGFAEPDYGYYGEPIEDYGYFAEDPYLSEDYAEIDPAFGYFGEVEPGYGYYSEVDPSMGYYGEVDPMVGYYAEPDYAMGDWGETDVYGAPFGYFAEEFPVGYYGEDPMIGYGEDFPVGYYGEEFPVGYYGEEFPVGYYGEDPYSGIGYYTQVPEMVGYGEPEFAEDYPPVGYYSEQEFGEPEFSSYGGYVRETSPAFNAGCPLPSNVSGFDDMDGFGAYMKPATVNPTCDQITSQPGTPPSPPETFKPLW